MDRDSFMERIKEIGSCEDATDRITLLTALTDEVGKIYDNMDSLNETITTLNDSTSKDKELINKLQQANMDLFKRLGSNKTPEEINQNATGIEEEPVKRKFEDLFKEGGDK